MAETSGTRSNGARKSSSNGADKGAEHDLQAQFDTLRADFKALAETLKETVSARSDDMLKDAKAQAAEAREKAQKKAEEAKEQLSDVQDQALEYIRKQPLSALGIAAAIGFLLGWLNRRND